MTVTTRPVPDHTTEQRPTSHCVPTRVDALADTDGHVLTVATHQDCPARAAYLTTDHTGDKGAVHCCLDPETMLIGRRAGWHPAVIIAASMVLRWPFHIYHGAWTSLPWAALWGGSYVAAFLYLRRLAPLIVFHAGSDAYIDMQSAYGDTGATLVLLVGAALVVFLALRITPDRRRRLNPTADTGDPKVARYLLFRDDWKNTAILAAAILAVIAGAIGLAPDAATRVLIGALIALTLGVGGRVLWASWVASNVIVHRDRAGAITGVIRWHTTYTGDTSIDTITTGLDDLDAISAVARLDGHTVVLPPTKARRTRLTAAGWADPHPRNPFRRIRIITGLDRGLLGCPRTRRTRTRSRCRGCRAYRPRSRRRPRERDQPWGGASPQGCR